MNNDPNNLVPTVHLPGSQYLHHLTLNTGQVARHPLRNQNYDGLRSLLAQGCGEIPGRPGYRFMLAESKNCCQFILGYAALELVTCGVAWGPGEAGCLWTWLRDYYQCTVPRIVGWYQPCPVQPPPLPWLGVVLHVNARFLNSAELIQVAALERDLALALIHKSTANN